ncbi:hypothetical protein [Ktedonospora formicarum]|uniref:Uncharacterized protein n=1 Tax=Ktedonospora formicarum TaxID=2778364 RepID=A0A8J3ID26_9CHLR|nr:hypothetical protein [Ktedonospora formicarum]GHO49879.1 hypothetical protein KSX_80420 [Ktedonospora formicarum]
MIGTLFEAGTVDKVVGNRLLISKLGLDEIAQGAYKILRSGGTFDMNFFPNEDVKLVAEALKRAGFENVNVELDLAVTASKP